MINEIKFNNLSDYTLNELLNSIIFLIKETNKIMSLIPKNNDCSEYHYQIVKALHDYKNLIQEYHNLKN